MRVPQQCSQDEASPSGAPGLNRALLEHYRCPEQVVVPQYAKIAASAPGYFRLGKNLILYGKCGAGGSSKADDVKICDAAPAIRIGDRQVQLPFDPSEIVDNLRMERYCGATTEVQSKTLVRNLYYLVRPLLPVAARKHLQSAALRGWEAIPFPKWPVDDTVGQFLEQMLILHMKAQKVETVPFIWFWPHGYPSCAIMTHDIEAPAGKEFCGQLMDLDDSFGIKSSFQVVPEKRYRVSEQFLAAFRERHFEVNIHDLKHDGHLFDSHQEFVRRAAMINGYAQQYGAQGFRSAILYRNLEWYDAFQVSYDMSVPNVGHLDPQHGGCCTVMPFFVGDIVELPLTTIQDYSLFHILRTYSTDLWKQQIGIIIARNGLISVNIHPDYIISTEGRRSYFGLLGILAQLKAEKQIWMTVPGEVNRWWRERSGMALVHENGAWCVRGFGSERAQVAYAQLMDDELVYTVTSTSGQGKSQ